MKAAKSPALTARAAQPVPAQPGRRVTELFGAVGLSNGLDWSDDRKAFCYADSNAAAPNLDRSPGYLASSARKAG
jgi:sugar lactone lactonase YvrE